MAQDRDALALHLGAQRLKGLLLRVQQAAGVLVDEHELFGGVSPSAAGVVLPALASSRRPATRTL